MIIVTGATGRLGSQIVDRLLDRVPADTVGVSVREPEQAASLSRRGVRVRAGDFTRPDTLAHAFEGADEVLIVSAAIRGPLAVTANKAAIDAAVAAGASRVLYTSHQAASQASLFAPQVVHAETEEHLARQPVPTTALRNGFYASTLGFYLGPALETGRLIAPADGPVSWTAHADLAEAAAVALSGAGALDGVSPPLTASAALDFEAAAAELSAISGRRVVRVVAGDEEWKEAAIRAGQPAAAADFSLGMFRAARRGEFDVTDPTLETLIGHPTTLVRSVLEELISGR